MSESRFSQEVLASFYDPPMKSRGMPFWAWNGTLQKEELVRQIRIMHEMGLGGFFMHSRIGLNTRYLGNEFMDCVKACIEEAEKLGMKACLYDEDRWPSGAAGGIVTKDHKYRSRFIYCREIVPGEEVDKYGKEDPLLALHLLRYKGGKLLSYERVNSIPSEALSPDTTLYGFYRGIAKDYSWFNDQAYLDTLNPEAVRRFLEVTHEEYHKRFAPHFGSTVPCIFSDEPNFRTLVPNDAEAWTDALPEKFMETYSYDLLSHLPELFFDCGNMVSPVRFHFHDLRTKLFTDAFAAQVGQWCSAHKIAMTGHVLAEDTLAGQIKTVGCAMRSYEHMQIPGIDLLTEHWQIFNTVKQCVSVARQCGKQYRLSETYGCTGWDFPFMGHKALGDWQYALGINYRCQHLAWYTMEGEAKRDYPSSISFQSSWHKTYPVVEDYFARLSAVLSQGEEIRDLLIIHPLDSYFALYHNNNDKDFLSRCYLDFTETTAKILSCNIDFDFGDEEMMSRLASLQGETLHVGRAEYKMVLIPRLYTIRKTTLDLLADFASKGGKVFYLGNDAPGFVDAKPSSEAQEVYKSFEQIRNDMFQEKLFARQERRISITGPSGEQTRTTLSRLAAVDQNNYSLFICNTGAEFSTDCFKSPFVRERNIAYAETHIEVCLPPGGSVYEMDAQNGRIHKVNFVYENGLYCFEASFAPLESHLYWIGEKVQSALPPQKEFFYTRKAYTFPREQWPVTLTGPNTLVLDHADLYLAGEKVLSHSFFIILDDFLREKLERSPRCGKMVQPYLQEKRPPEKTLDMELHYRFQCGNVPASDCFLVLERPELYSQITLNGATLDQTPCSWWVDPSLQKLSLPGGILRSGENLLVLKGNYHEKLPGLESLFILGDFAVFQEKIADPVRTLDLGDWTNQGLEEYASDVIYCNTFTKPALKEGERVFISIPKWRGVSLGVSVNGSEEQYMPYPPFESDITDFIQDGDNHLAIRLYGSCRNAFGPFFTTQCWELWTGPNQFKEYSSPVRQTVPCGILGNVSLLIKGTR